MESKSQFKWSDTEFETVLSFFEEISKIPRPSKHEKEIASYIEEFGKKNGFETRRDEFDNVVICVPASAGYENKPTVVLQSHTDMVCQKEPDSSHNFFTDSLELSYVFENGVPFLKANKTTLGADDGIGMAYALATAVSKSLSHPPMELLFTSDEEEGLNGAQNMSADFITGKYLINLDSEEEGILIVGCSGGAQFRFARSFPFENSAKSKTDSHPAEFTYQLTVSGLLGGHSGTDIHLNRGNAISIAGSFLKKMSEKYNGSFHLADIRGGTAHNAIPRDCIGIFISTIPEDLIQKEAAEFFSQTQEAIHHEESSFRFKVEPLNEQMPHFSSANTNQIAHFLTELKAGVFEMSPLFENTVICSGNLAIVQTIDPPVCDCAALENEAPHKNIEIIYGLRSGDDSLYRQKMKDLIALGEKFGYRVEISNTYHPWSPNFGSSFLKKCTDVYQSLFQKEPKIAVIHAGLECSVFSKNNPDIEMIAIGPDILYAHSPSEKLNLITAEKVWVYLKEILKSFGDE